MPYRVAIPPTGLYGGKPWPATGELAPDDLPEHVAEGMVKSGHLEKVDEPKVEKRPASTKGVEKRKGAE